MRTFSLRFAWVVSLGLACQSSPKLTIQNGYDGQLVVGYDDVTLNDSLKVSLTVSVPRDSLGQTPGYVSFQFHHPQIRRRFREDHRIRLMADSKRLHATGFYFRGSDKLRPTEYLYAYVRFDDFQRMVDAEQLTMHLGPETVTFNDAIRESMHEMHRLVGNRQSLVRMMPAPG